jgi:hypothetical protein
MLQHLQYQQRQVSDMSKTLINNSTNKIEIDFINNNTREVIKKVGVTQKGEFFDVRGNPVNEGVSYHIHNTYDNETYYMTGEEHEISSILIFKTNDDSMLSRYKSLVEKQRTTYLNETRSAPSELDYDRGFFTMYFARQANDKTSKIFEITENDFIRKTPFYIKTPIQLKITGDKDVVEKYNKPIIDRFPLNNILSPLQFYRPSKNTKESVQDRLKNYKQTIPSSTSAGSSGGSSGGGY